MLHPRSERHCRPGWSSSGRCLRPATRVFQKRAERQASPPPAAARTTGADEAPAIAAAVSANGLFLDGGILGVAAGGFGHGVERAHNGEANGG